MMDGLAPYLTESDVRFARTSASNWTFQLNEI